ncbi:hypothetical protein WJX72_009209 [[Myrmecia] bisecta]|uniref:DNA-directed primase/polymerase protein n=1 Tax=[Myrmecia] bisecta TaxID=41462 RepID=A0AAW1PTN4_9CHLO
MAAIGQTGTPAMFMGPQRPTGVSCPAHAAKVYTTFVWQRDAIAFADRCNRAAAGLPEEEPCAAETSMRPPGNPAADLACHAEPAVTGETQPGTGVGVFYRSSDAETQEPPGSRRLDEIVKVFCQERGGERGYHRQFVAASHAALWARCNALPPQDRHYYEVIKEGSPCHLYFDLEYATACNADVDGDALVEKLLCMVSQRLKQEWGFDMQPDWVVELDSSSATKFSRHLTIRIPGHAFPNNHAIGCLVSQLLASSEAMQLMVRKGGADEAAHTFTSFVDSAVYTKNRHFRIIWNSKGGKTATLVPTERFATAPGHGMSRQQLFLESLICNVPPTARLLHVDGSNTTLTGSRAAGTAHPLRTCLPVSPGRAGSSVKVVRLCDEGEQAPEGLSLQRVQAWAEAAKGFVEQMARQRAGGQPATARTIAHCGLAGTVAYSMIGPGSHYCENIGRCHQSNHVYYVVNFVEGAYAQKCHDPDCSSFRSAWMPLPAELRLT